jgi:hypothetical protein
MEYFAFSLEAHLTLQFELRTGAFEFEFDSNHFRILRKEYDFAAHYLQAMLRYDL